MNDFVKEIQVGDKFYSYTFNGREVEERIWIDSGPNSSSRAIGNIFRSDEEAWKRSLFLRIKHTIIDDRLKIRRASGDMSYRKFT